MRREEFGDEFNLNDYLAGQVKLDNPMVDLNAIEAAIRAGK